MKRLHCAVMLLALVGCGGGEPPVETADGGVNNYGLPPAGDGGQVFSLGPWDELQTEDKTGYRYLLAYATNHRGGNASLSGSGDPDLLAWRDPDGTLIRWSLYGRAAFRPIWVSHTFPDGRVVVTIDRNENTTADVQIEEDPSANRRVELFDDDYDGKWERRRITTIDSAASRQTVVVERDPMQTDAWVELSRDTMPLSVDQSGSDMCDGSSNFPGQFEDVTVLSSKSAGNITVLADTTAECKGDNLKKARAALSCAMKKIHECMPDSNAELAARVQEGVSRHDIIVGCNNPCSGRDATTKVKFQVPAGFYTAINLRPDFSTLDDDTACAVVLHELMHAARVPHGPNHDDGEDSIYACARYCNGCIKRGNAQLTDVEDCVACAGTAKEKEACGIKEEVQDGQCSTAAVCHAGLAGNMPCETCSVKVRKDCEGNQIGSSETLLCCKTCPSAYPTNSDPCGGNPTLRDDCANRQPPKCR